MTVVFSLEVVSVVYEANEVSLYLMLKDFELHVQDIRTSEGFEQEHDTIMDWAAIWIPIKDMGY